jgi:membrane protease YdiL (CAAX protease family)
MSDITSRAKSVSSTAAPSQVQRHPLLAYFAIAFAGTWALTIPLALSSGLNLFPLPDIAFVLLFIFSIYTGPFLGALIITRATEGRTGIRQLLKRAVQWRVGVRWYLAAIFSFLLIWLVSFSFLYSGAPLRGLIANPLLLVTSFLPWLLQGIFIPALGEELGWRGFALPRLQAQYGPVLATIILGVARTLAFTHPVYSTPGPVHAGETHYLRADRDRRRIPL